MLHEVIEFCSNELEKQLHWKSRNLFSISEEGQLCSNPSAITNLIEHICADSHALSEIADRSFWHRAGFAKINLLADYHSTPNIRLHIWTEDSKMPELNGVHIHPWHLWSTVVEGSLRFRIYRRSEVAGDEYSERILHAIEHKGFQEQPNGKSKLMTSFDATMTAGTSYFFLAGDIHDAAPGSKDRTLTCAIRSQFLTNESRAFDQPQIEKPIFATQKRITARELLVLLAGERIPVCTNTNIQDLFTRQVA
jgi:hypothetical protein